MRDHETAWPSLAAIDLPTRVDTAVFEPSPHQDAAGGAT